MNFITATELRYKLPQFLKEVIASGEPGLVTRHGKGWVVIWPFQENEIGFKGKPTNNKRINCKADRKEAA